MALHRHEAGHSQMGQWCSLGFPRAFLESDDVRDLIYGDTWRRLSLATRPLLG